MLDVRKPRLRPYAPEGNFGLEREALRVTAEGRMALTPHPFPPDRIEIRCVDLNPLTGGLVDVRDVAFSTRPLSIGKWEPVPFTSLVAAKDGEIVRTSPPHGNEYIYNPEDYRLVYMNFARL